MSDFNNSVYEELLRRFNEGRVRIPKPLYDFESMYQGRRRRGNSITVTEVRDICQQAAAKGWKARKEQVGDEYKFTFIKSDGRRIDGQSDPDEQQALANAAAYLRSCGI